MKALVFLADGVEPLEAVTIIDVLRRAEVDVTTVSLTDNVAIRAAHRIMLTADTVWSAVDFNTFRALVLPGGGKGTENFLADNRVLMAIRAFMETDRIVAAICAATTVLAAAGILKGRRATCYPTCAGLLGQSYDPMPVVVDGNIITGQGPGAAMLFALAIVQQLKGEEAAHRVADRLLTTFE